MDLVKSLKPVQYAVPLIYGKRYHVTFIYHQSAFTWVKTTTEKLERNENLKCYFYDRDRIPGQKKPWLDENGDFFKNTMNLVVVLNEDFVKDSVCKRQLRRSQLLKQEGEIFNLIPLCLDEYVIPKTLVEERYLEVEDDDAWWPKFTKAVTRDPVKSSGDIDKLKFEANTLLHHLNSANLEEVFESLQLPIAKDIGHYLTQGRILQIDPLLKLLASDKTSHAVFFCHPSDMAEVQKIAPVIERENKLLISVLDRPVVACGESMATSRNKKQLSISEKPSGCGFATTDSSTVELLCDSSCDQGHECVQPIAVHMGVDVERGTPHFSRSSKTVIALSPDMVSNPGYRRQIRLLLEKEDQNGDVDSVIPCRLKACEIPENLRDLCHVDSGEFLWLDKIVHAIQNVNLPRRTIKDDVKNKIERQFSRLASELKKFGTETFSKSLVSQSIVEMKPYFILGEWFFYLLMVIRQYGIFSGKVFLALSLDDIFAITSAIKMKHHVLKKFCRRIEAHFNLTMCKLKPSIPMVPATFCTTLKLMCVSVEHIYLFPCEYRYLPRVQVFGQRHKVDELIKTCTGGEMQLIHSYTLNILQNVGPATGLEVAKHIFDLFEIIIPEDRRTTDTDDHHKVVIVNDGGKFSITVDDDEEMWTPMYLLAQKLNNLHVPCVLG